MNRNKILFTIFFAGIISHCVAAQSEDLSSYNPEGPWIASWAPSNPYGFSGVHYLMTFFPMGQQANQWSAILDAHMGDPKFFGNPNAASYTAFHGILVKTSNNHFEISGYGFILDSNGEDLFILQANGVGSFLSRDEMFFDLSLSIYTPSQDADSDGVPESGDPASCLPALRYNLKRIALTPPYIPVYSPGDVWATDNMQSNQNLVGNIDEDLASDPSIVIHWYLDSQDVKEYHIYISENGGSYQYLGHTLDKAENYYEWKPGDRQFQNPAFDAGPQSGSSYSFMIFTVTASGQPFCLGPYTTKGSVFFHESQEPNEHLSAVAEMYQALNIHNMKKAFSYSTDDVIYDDASRPSPFQGETAITAYFNAVFQGVPDIVGNVTRVFISPDNNFIVNEAIDTGTHLGVFAGMPATGKQISFRLLHTYEFTENKVSRITEYIDHLGILVQFGVIPAPQFPPLTPSFELPEPVPNRLTPVEGMKETYTRWNKHDLASVAEGYAEGKYMSAFFNGAPLNRDQYFALLELLFTASSDMQGEFVRTVELNDGWVLGELIFKGTSTGPYFGIPATGKTFELRGANLSHFNEDGLITENEIYWDQVSLLQQIGVLK